MKFKAMGQALGDPFWSKVAKSDGCWLWTGCKSDFGHGTIRINTRLYRAHRIAWEMKRGKIPPGLCVLHRCDQPACVRVDHLFLGTKKDNSEDMVAKGRSAVGDRNGSRTSPERMSRGVNRPLAKLTEDVVVRIRERYALGGISQDDLADLYGVHQMQISRVVRRVTWKHV